MFFGALPSVQITLRPKTPGCTASIASLFTGVDSGDFRRRNPVMHHASQEQGPYLGNARRFWVSLSLAIVTLVFGSIGVWKYEHAYHPEAHHAFGPLYAAVQMLILHTPHFEHGVNVWIEVGRWLGASFFIYTALTLFWNHLRRGEYLVWFLRLRDHYVVCGGGQKGFEIVDSLLKRTPSARVVVIDPNPDPHQIEHLTPYRTIVIPADATQRSSLRRAHVAQAAEIIVVTPADETNVAIATAVREELVGRAPGSVPCRVQLSDIDLRESLALWDENARAGRSGCRLHFFDVFDAEARRRLGESPLDGAGIGPASDAQVHVAILGFGRMARSLALRCLKSGHFANGKPLRLSIVTRDAAKEKERFLFRYPSLAGDIPDSMDLCKIDFRQGEAQSLTTREWILNWSKEPATHFFLFVCLDHDARAVEVALRLRAALAASHNAQIHVRISSRGSLSPMLQASDAPNPRIVPFGMVEETCTEEAYLRDSDEALARAIHQQFVADVSGKGGRSPQNDLALKDWDELREDFRESNRQQANHLRVKLRAIGCELAPLNDPKEAVTNFISNEIETMARMEHSRWNMERLLNGWRPGLPANKLLRIHPDLVRWPDLPTTSKDYDRGAVARIPLLLERTRYPGKVVRQQQPTACNGPDGPN
jgi:hypothetical protein